MYMIFNILYLSISVLAYDRNLCRNPRSRRNTTDVQRERWKHGGGPGPNVMFVSGHVGRQSRRHQADDPRPGSGAVPNLFRAEERPGPGGESVLRQIPGEDPETAQVSPATHGHRADTSWENSSAESSFGHREANVTHTTSRLISA